MTPIWRVATCLTTAVLLSGCVTAERYNALEANYLSERQTRAQLEAGIAERNARQQALDSELEQARARMAALSQDAQSLSSSAIMTSRELAEARERLSQAELRNHELEQQQHGMSKRLEQALEELGRQDGIEYSRNQRRLALSDALLFASGETYIGPAGRDALAQLAAGMVGGRERLRIEGHTDSDPISRTSTLWRHGNWELSGARALEVLAVLEQAGVASERLSFAGFGPHRPLVPNDSHLGKSRNRRVEIFVLPPAPPVTGAEPVTATDSPMTTPASNR